MQIVTSSFQHEMITPLKCIVEMSRTNVIETEDPRVKYRCELIENQAALLMRLSKQNLDAGLLRVGHFLPQYEQLDLCDLVERTTQLLSM